MALVAGALERERLHATFEALCRIPSPTGDERAVADWLTNELSAIGLVVEEDQAGSRIGSSAGNLLTRLPAAVPDVAASAEPPTVLLCAHMDTVPLSAAVEPVIREGGWENANDGILGADNKAAVAAMVELARMRTEAPAAGNAIGVELLFTVAEETGLNGAREFDLSRLSSSFGYVFDHASPVGEIITASPTHMRIRAVIRGRAAHAGLEPEAGVSAVVAAANAILRMPQGRFDPETTANIGTVRGGTATNVVPDCCVVTAEVRAVEQGQLDHFLTEAIDALQDAADTAGCDLDLDVQEMFTGYRIGARDPTVALAQRTLRRLGYEPTLRSSGGGADANAFRRAGFPCTNLANGTERAHQPSERVSLAALEANLDLMLSLIDEAGA